MSYSYVPNDDSVELIDDVTVRQGGGSSSILPTKLRSTKWFLLGGTISVLVGVVILIVVGVILGVRHHQNRNQKQSEREACGVDLLPASAELCGKLLDSANILNGAEKCIAYEAFLTCTAVYLCTHGVTWNQCGFKTLHKLLLTSEPSSDNPSHVHVCGNDSSSRFEYMDKHFPIPVIPICINSDIYEYFLKFVCPVSKIHFAGSSLLDQCLSMISRTLCMKNMFHEAKLNCTDDRIEHTTNLILEKSPVVDKDFNIDNRTRFCESSFPCARAELKDALADTGLGVCVHAVNRFLYLSGLGVDINNITTMDSETEHMKCRVWGIFTMCALPSVSPNCQQHIQQIQKGLQILANVQSEKAEAAVVKVDIFNECDGYTRSLNDCPEKQELVYSTIAYCSYQAIKLFQENNTTEKACKHLDLCEQSIKSSYKDCSTIDDYFKDFKGNDTQAYLKNITGFDCG